MRDVSELLHHFPSYIDRSGYDALRRTAHFPPELAVDNAEDTFQTQ